MISENNYFENKTLSVVYLQLSAPLLYPADILPLAKTFPIQPVIERNTALKSMTELEI